MAGNHGKSIKRPAVYEDLREKGYSKSKAAAISNAMWKGGKGKGKGKGKRKGKGGKRK